MSSLLAQIPSSLPQELVETLAQGEAVCIQRIVSRGNVSPPGFWYDQEQNEWVLLVCGAARLRFEHELMELKPGDFILIPAHRRHRVEWTTPDEPTIWLVVFYN